MSRRPAPSLLFRCPVCGDQTKQRAGGGRCGLCFLANGKSVELVACSREMHLVGSTPGALETASGLGSARVGVQTASRRHDRDS